MSSVPTFTPPGVPSGCHRRRREIARLEWWRHQPGDPAGLLEGFCASLGLPVADLSHPGTHDTVPGSVCGVAILVSAAAGAVMIGADAGQPSPAVSVPDLVAVAYEHVAADVEMAERSSVVLRLGPWWSSWSRDDHAAAVQRVREAIGRGDVYQVNMVGHHSSQFTGDTMAALARVAALSDGGEFSGGMAGAGWAVASGSPECLLEVAGGQITTRPIKGTREATELGEKELRTSVKERAEHVMIVDLERNDLARVAVPGTVAVTDFFALRHWCGLWQAESTVSARLAAGTGLARVMRAVCPPGSVTGAPKVAALRQIAALEPVGRGPAMGGMGYLTAQQLSMGLTIRTVAVSGDRIHVWAGGGITWRSEPEAEVEEAFAKAAPVKRALSGDIPTE